MDSETLYEADFAAWSAQQARALRALAGRGDALPAGLDPEHLAEQIEDLGARDRHVLASALARVIEHLLKLEYSPAPEPRRGWRDSVTNHREAVQESLTQSPSLKPELPTLPTKSFRKGRELAAIGLQPDRIDPSMLPAELPYSLVEILDHAWWPANRHDLE
ncbi:MAG: DUF29 family protein [Alphaproteobacteria bacterium]|jgi:hypothetical protein|nr:DUF29 family protein [Alphaproteobacteria bacterium]